MDDQLKRLAVISVLILLMALALLLPAKWGLPKRPGNVPSTAAFANGGKGRIYWIDCASLDGAGTHYSCTVYQAKSGDIVLKGIFQQISFTQQPPRIFYDGSAIHWRHGQLLSPLHLQCVAGGRPPMVADCKSGQVNTFKP